MKKKAAPNSSLKKWLRRSLILLGILAGLILWDYSIHKNFSIIAPGKLYRSGQPSEKQLEQWIKDFQLKTIICLRHSVPDYEKQLAKKYNIALHQIILSSKRPPSEKEWLKIKNLITDENNLPLLLHCRSGADRTGIITALYRLEIEGWPLWKAFLEMDRHYHLALCRPSLQRYLRNQYSPKEPGDQTISVPASP